VAIEKNTLISPVSNAEDRAIEKSIRPQWLSDYVGQARVREQMEIFIKICISYFPILPLWL